MPQQLERDPATVAPPGPTPVFVDSSGRRRRLLRRILVLLGAVAVGYGGLIAVSLAGGPVPPGVPLPAPATPVPGLSPQPAAHSPSGTGVANTLVGPAVTFPRPTGSAAIAVPSASAAPVASASPPATVPASGWVPPGKARKTATPSPTHRH